MNSGDSLTREVFQDPAGVLPGSDLPVSPLLADFGAAAATGVPATRSFVVVLQKQASHRFACGLRPRGTVLLPHPFLS